MAQLATVIVPAKVLKGGKHKIRIAVSHLSETRYIVTDIIIDNAKQFKNGQITGRHDANYLNTKLRRLMDKYQRRLDDIEYIEGLTCSELVTELKDDRLSKDATIGSVFNLMQEYAGTRSSSKNTELLQYHSFIKYMKPETPFRKINRLTVMGYDKFLRDRKLSKATINDYVGFIFRITAFAKKAGIVGAEFNLDGSFKRYPPVVRDAWLTPEDIRRVRDYQPKKDIDEQCRDLFMLSYYLGGMNLVDIINTNFKNCKDEIRYVRSKIKGRCECEVRYMIPDEAKQLIRKYISKDGHVAKPNCMGRHMTTRMKKMREELGIPNLIFYSARKSFSQHAFELGVSTQVIDYVLGHSLRSSGMIYHYVNVKPEMATEAIRRVIDNLNKAGEAEASPTDC